MHLVVASKKFQLLWHLEIELALAHSSKSIFTLHVTVYFQKKICFDNNPLLAKNPHCLLYFHVQYNTMYLDDLLDIPNFDEDLKSKNDLYESFWFQFKNLCIPTTKMFLTPLSPPTKFWKSFQFGKTIHVKFCYNSGIFIWRRNF